MRHAHKATVNARLVNASKLFDGSESAVFSAAGQFSGFGRLIAVKPPENGAEGGWRRVLALCLNFELALLICAVQHVLVKKMPRRTGAQVEHLGQADRNFLDCARLGWIGFGKGNAYLSPIVADDDFVIFWDQFLLG